jgi:hypothetical protein
MVSLQSKNASHFSASNVGTTCCHGVHDDGKMSDRSLRIGERDPAQAWVGEQATGRAAGTVAEVSKPSDRFLV